MSRAEQKRQTHQRVLEGATRGFLKSGYAGIGVDGLAEEAGVTSGAFYKHFPSKSQALKEAVVFGMQRLKEGVLQHQAEYGNNWWPRFVHFYLNEHRLCDLSESCILPALTEEVVRSKLPARRAYEKGLQEVAIAISTGPESPSVPRQAQSAYAALATLLGGVAVARAVTDPDLARLIAASVERGLLTAPHLSSAPDRLSVKWTSITEAIC